MVGKIIMWVKRSVLNTTFSWSFVSYLVVSVVGLVNGEDLTRPHIVFILADDAGWNDFSFHGSAQIPTPNIDALAFSGAVLNSYYGSPLCTPSRGSILTGKYPIHLGLQHYVIRGDTADGLPLSEKLLPEYLKELGYSTHLVGKWHLGHARKDFSPTFRGFDTHFGCWLGNQDYYDHTSTDAGYWGFDFRNGMDVNKESFGLYNTDLFTEEAVRLIRQQPTNQPMFLMISHTAPHVGGEYDPLQAPRENIEKFKDSIADENRRVYAATTAELQKEFEPIEPSRIKYPIFCGKIRAIKWIHVDPKMSSPDTKVAMVHMLVKNTLWEGGTRLAACIWSVDIRNRVSKDLMHVSDWLPTLYEAAGGNVTDLGSIDGVSLWKTLTSTEPSPRNELLYNIDDIYNNSAVRFDSWKLIQGNTSTYDFGGGIWDGWYGHYLSNSTVEDLLPNILASGVAKALENIGLSLKPDVIRTLQYDAQVYCNNHSNLQQIACNPYDGPCLFNVVEDPCEQNNLAAQQHQLVLQMLELIHSFNATAHEIIDLSHHQEAAPQNWGYVWTNWKDFMD